MNRRTFLKNSLVSTAAFAASTTAFSQTKNKVNEFAIFTKPFQHLNYSDFADLMAEIGVDGVVIAISECCEAKKLAFCIGFKIRFKIII